MAAGQAVTLGVPTWVNVGPTQINESGTTDAGAIPAFAVDPTNADRVFIASVDGGVWRTTDATTASPQGPTWTPLTDQLPFLGTSAIAFSPLDPTENTLFVGTGRFSNRFVQPGPSVGLYMTTNAGAAPGAITWTQLGASVFKGLAIHSVVPTPVLDPVTGKQVILVATTYDPASGTDFSNGASTGLYRNADGGKTWKLISGQAAGGLPAGDVTSIGRPAASELRFWTSRLYAGAKASTVARAIWGSREHRFLVDQHLIPALSLERSYVDALRAGHLAALSRSRR